nr:hypothetical protein CFP56_22524 [Quercus suber]
MYSLLLEATLLHHQATFPHVSRVPDHIAVGCGRIYLKVYGTSLTALIELSLMRQPSDSRLDGPSTLGERVLKVGLKGYAVAAFIAVVPLFLVQADCPLSATAPWPAP